MTDEHEREYRRIRREAYALVAEYRRADLYRVALGMPARNQASKLELAQWLLRYAPDRIPNLKVTR